MEIAVEDGPKQLTMDNVAKRCGMSKGGLMHHFPSKDVLLKRMTDNMLEKVNDYSKSLTERYADKLAITNIMRTRKIVDEKIGINEAKILLVAAIENPELLSSVAQAVREKTQAILSEPQSDMGLLLMLAADGLAFQELLGISPFNQRERDELGNKLIEMAVALEGEHGE